MQFQKAFRRWSVGRSLYHRLLPALATAILAHAANGQCGQSVQKFTVDGSANDMLHSVLSHSNGDIYTAGLTNSFSGDYDLYLARYTAGQQLAWAKLYDSGSDEGGLSMCLSSGPSGNLYLGGTRNGIGTSSEDGYLIKMDTDGNVLWARSLVPEAGYCQVREVAEALDGTVYVVGSINSIGAGLTDMFMARFDPSGQLQWLNSYGWSGQDHFTDVEVLGDGTIMAGSHSMWTNNIRKGCVARIGANGVPVSATLHNGGNMDSYTHVLRDPDGTFLWVGNTSSYGAGGSDVLVSLTDSLGQPIWSRAYGTTANEEGLNGISDGNGGWYISAWQGAQQQDHIVHIASDGALIGAWKIDGLGLDATARWGVPLARAANGTVFQVGNDASGGMGSSMVFQELDACARSGCGSTETTWTMTSFTFPVQNVQLPISGSSNNVVPLSVSVTDITAMVTQLTEVVNCDTCALLATLGDMQACTGELLEFNPVITGGDAFSLNWLWDFGDGSTSTEEGGTSHSFALAGTFQVTLVVQDTSGSCADSVSVPVSVVQLPVPDLGSDTVLCSGAFIQLNADVSGPWSVAWSDGSSGPQLSVSTPGEDWVEYAFADCSARDSLQVSLAPSVALPDTLVTCVDGRSEVDWSDLLTSIVWVGEGSGPVISLHVGEHEYTGVDMYGCSYSGTLSVVADPDLIVPSLIPNVFTPNHDLANDRFLVSGAAKHDFNLQVYDRWGGLVFESRIPDRGWDGRIDGQEASAGTYFYVVRYFPLCGSSGLITKVGHLTLLR